MELRQAALWIERTINHRMLDRTDIYRHRLAVSLNEDGNAVTGRKEKRCVNDILSHGNLDAANFRYDISLLQAGLSCRSSGVELRDVDLRTFTRFILILDVCADPSVPRPAEPDIVQSNLFRGFYRQGVARSAPIDAGNYNPDHLTLEIH